MTLKCTRCGITASKRWIVCGYGVGNRKQIFCLKCHREGYKGGWSYIDDPPFRQRRTPKAKTKGDKT